MSKKLIAAFVKWKLQGLVVTRKVIYQIDSNEKIIHAVIDHDGFRCGFDTKMNIIYREKNGKPVEVIKFNEVYDDLNNNNWMKKYDKVVSRLYDFNG